MSKQILIVADDPAIHPGLPNLIRTLGHEATVSAGAAAAIAHLGAGRFDLCIVDLGLPAGEGAAVVMKARACRPAVTALALIEHGSVAGAVEALRAGAADVVAKPFHASALEDALRRATVAASETAALGRRTPGVAVIGDHPAMRLVLDRVEQIADTEASVLVRGETGTGKEVIARLIHGASARRTGPFVAVNLAAIPESLAEAELFGHVQGAFTGATGRGRAGWPPPHGGTLFLDEIGEMPPQRAGEAAARAAGGRGHAGRRRRRRSPSTCGWSRRRTAISTAMIASGRFREDLYYRLDVLPIEIPPLRARREDIPALAEHFRREMNAREGRSVPGFALDVMQRLSHYHWPGNVRELENLVERVVVVAGTRMVAMNDLPCHLRTQVLDLERAASIFPPRASTSGSC